MGVIGRIFRLSHLFQQAVQEVFSDYGLHRGEFDVLATLRRSGEPYRLTPTELSNALMVSSGGMTNRLDRLEKAGLVVRQPDPDDRRGSLVGLTQKGLDLVDEAVAEHVANEHHLLSVLEDKEQAELAEQLRKLLISLESPRHRPSVRKKS